MAPSRIKICGLTRSEDVRCAVACGADALGFVFYEASPRSVTIEQAARLLDDLPPFVTAVGLFVNADNHFIQEAVERLPLSLLQFHGDETPAHCEAAGLPYIKAVRLPLVDAEQAVKDQAKLALSQEMQQHTQACGFLLDALSNAARGGTGEQFDWDLLPAQNSRPLVLAGGLNANNVAAAIRAHRPYAVDVSSGVEISAGIKDAKKIEKFVQTVVNSC